MDKMIYLSNLYEIYKGLFTDKQRLYFENYYYNNLSLAEIAENEDVSRNAVHSQLKIVEERLIELESILEIASKREKVLKYVQDKLNDKEKEQLENLL